MELQVLSGGTTGKEANPDRSYSNAFFRKPKFDLGPNASAGLVQSQMTSHNGLVWSGRVGVLLVKEVECEELVLPSLPPLVRRTEERDELVCGSVRYIVT